MKKDPANKEVMKDMPDMDSMMKIMGRKEVQAELKKMSPGIASTKLPAKNDKLIFLKICINYFDPFTSLIFTCLI